MSKTDHKRSVAEQNICPYLASLLSFFLLCSRGKEQDPLTAKEYYHDLLLKEGYSPSFRQLSEDEIRSFVRRFRKAYPTLTEDEIYRKFKEAAPFSNPVDKIKPLLKDILDNTPPKYNRDFPDIFAAEFPLNEINASVIAPNGGILILLNRGLVKSFHEWAKPIINIVLGGVAPEFTADADLEELMISLKESIQGYIDNGEIPAFLMYATDQKSILSTVLGASATQFVLAHECAHAILGHLDNKVDLDPKAKSYKDPLEKEIEADRVAAEMLLYNVDLRPDAINGKTRMLDIQMKLAGIYYCLTMFEIMEQFRTPKHDINKSYPNLLIRLGCMKRYLQQKLGDSSKYQFFNRINYALNLVAESSLASNPKVETLPDDMRIIKRYYLAYKSGNNEMMLELISQNLDFFAEWVGKLLDLAQIFARGDLQDAVTGWSEGDYLDSSDIFKFALSINKLYKQKTQKDAADEILENGSEIIRVLRESAKVYESQRVFDASKHKLWQAEKISETIDSLRYDSHINILQRFFGFCRKLIC